MSTIVINPNVPLVAVQGVTADVILQPGTVISAQVQQILGNGQVQISIGGQSIVVMSQVPLQTGQMLQLAVSQALDGSIGLAVLNPGLGAAGQTVADLTSAGLTADLVALTAGAIANLAAPATAVTVAAPNQLTPPEALAVTVAAQAAATQQASLAPLFADLSLAAGVNGLPPKVQQAVAQVLAQRISLAPSLTGADIKQAFQRSGLFLEASLASGSVALDLKAALIVLRQVLTTSLGDAAPTPTPGSTAPTTTVTTAQPGSVVPSQDTPAAVQVSSLPVTIEPDTSSVVSPALVPLLAPETVGPEAFTSRHGVAAAGGRIRPRRGERRHVFASDDRRRRRARCGQQCRPQFAAGSGAGGSPEFAEFVKPRARGGPGAVLAAGGDRGAPCEYRGRRVCPHHPAAAAAQRGIAGGAAGAAGDAGTEFVGPGRHAAFARGHRWRARAADAAAGRFAARPGRSPRSGGSIRRCRAGILKFHL